MMSPVGQNRRERMRGSEGRSKRRPYLRTMGAHGCAGSTPGQAWAANSGSPSKLRTSEIPHSSPMLLEHNRSTREDFRLSRGPQDGAATSCRLALLLRSGHLARPLHGSPVFFGHGGVAEMKLAREFGDARPVARLLGENQLIDRAR